MRKFLTTLCILIASSSMSRAVEFQSTEEIFNEAETTLSKNKTYRPSHFYEKLSEKLSKGIKILPQSHLPPRNAFIKKVLPAFEVFESKKLPNLLEFLKDATELRPFTKVDATGQRIMDISYLWGANCVYIIQSSSTIALREILSLSKGHFIMSASEEDIPGIVNFSPEEGEVSKKLIIYKGETGGERLMSFIFTIVPIKVVFEGKHSFFRNLTLRSAGLFASSSAAKGLHAHNRNRIVRKTNTIDEIKFSKNMRESEAREKIDNLKLGTHHKKSESSSLPNRVRTRSNTMTAQIEDTKNLQFTSSAIKRQNSKKEESKTQEPPKAIKTATKRD